MEYWENKTETVTSAHKNNLSLEAEILRVLNTEGTNGWELVLIDKDYNTSTANIYFKRKLSEQNAITQRQRLGLPRKGGQ